ncbi:MAG: DUF1330 domain-containing protein [candidate division Zixibacteria bacterium]|nr:DUF1330 domain-containing protein [candidate division Zixibacteria bacterium]
MPAYFFVDILEITDESKMEEYRSKVVETVQQYNGRYVVLGGQYEQVEGDWCPKFPVLIEFADKDQVKRWYNSPEYQAIVTSRLEGTRSNAVILEGLLA